MLSREQRHTTSIKTKLLVVFTIACAAIGTAIPYALSLPDVYTPIGTIGGSLVGAGVGIVLVGTPDRGTLKANP